MNDFNKHIFLTGFMGSGKNTIGRELARLLKRPLLDMDEKLARQFKMPVPAVFAAHGEAAFRKAESALLVKIAAMEHPCIVATGGGVVLNQDNLKIMDSAGKRIFLDAPLDVIERRINSAEEARRPLWCGHEQAASLYAARYPVYNSAPMRADAANKPALAALDIARQLFIPMHARLTAMDNTCLLQTAWDTLSPVSDETGNRKKALLLDNALAGQAGSWQEQGFVVRVMRHKGEALKTLKHSGQILEWMLKQELARDDYLVVRGGGSLSDMAAFCAGLYKRGLNLILVATTLLAAVDAAIGGKTAINFMGHKNQVGHFYLPRRVIIDVPAFNSLKPGQVADGLVEAYKTGLIADPQLARFIESNLALLKKGDTLGLAWVAGRCMQIKSSLVERDFREERGLRDVLNLGHTFGHVVESWSQYKISHGRAVAAGLLAAINLSRKKAGLANEEAERMLATIKNMTRPPQLPPVHMVENIIRQDKKYRANSMGFVVLYKCGQAGLTHGLCLEDVLDAAYGVKDEQ